MKLSLITPAPKHSRAGNRVTALRWARILRTLGHDVRIVTKFEGSPCDMMIGLHARKSHPSIARFRQRHPRKPMVVALTGTDLYQDLPDSPEARESLELADRLVVLHPLAVEELPKACRPKARTIYQSAVQPRGPVERRQRTFDVCVLGHLRPVKDPFRAAHAARGLPSSSRVRILHVGAALESEMEKTARAEMETNPRYRWLGEKPRWQARRIMAGCRLLVLSSKAEGGANVIGEAVAASVPILASRISGSVGLLGDDYPGYFAVGATESLCHLILRAETAPDFLSELQAWGERLKPLFLPQREETAWRDLLAEFCSPSAKLLGG